MKYLAHGGVLSGAMRSGGLEVRPARVGLVVEGGVELVGSEESPAAAGAGPGGLADDHDVTDRETALASTPVGDRPRVVRAGDVELLEHDLQRARDHVLGRHVIEDFEVEPGGFAQFGGRVSVKPGEVVVAVVEVYDRGDVRHDVAPFCAVSGAPVSAGGAVNRLRVGGQPRRARVGRSRVFGPGRSPARSVLGIDFHRAEKVTRPAQPGVGVG